MRLGSGRFAVSTKLVWGMVTAQEAPEPYPKGDEGLSLTDVQGKGSGQRKKTAQRC